MILTVRVGAACLATLAALTGCTASRHAASDPLVSVSSAFGSSASGASASAAGSTGGSTSESGSATGRPGAARSAGAPRVSGPPTSLNALPTVLGASPSHTPPLTPVSKLACPNHIAMTKAFGSAMTGDPVDGDDDPKRLYCGYQTAGATPYVLSVTTSDYGHAGYVTQADNIRTVANGTGTVQPVLGLGDEAIVEMDGGGSSTYAGKLLVRFGERTVLVYTTSPSSNLQRLSQVAMLFY